MYRIAHLTESDTSFLRLCSFGNDDIIRGNCCDLICGYGLEVLFEKARRLIHLCLLKYVANVSAVSDILIGFGNIKCLCERKG